MTERQVRRGPPASIQASTWWWIRAAAILVTIFVAVQLLGVVQSVVSALLTVVLYVLFGAVIAFIAGPVVQLLEQRARLPRTLAILVTLFAGLPSSASSGSSSQPRSSTRHRSSPSRALR